MPKYTYTCTCGKSKKSYQPSDISSILCECGGEMTRQMPTTSRADVKEVVDSFMGLSIDPDQDAILKERKLDYYWAVEVPRLCNQYSPAHCLTNGWMYIDEKGQLQIHTKPPHKR